MRARMLAAGLAAALAVPALAACSSSGADAFCSDIEAAGGSGATMGTLQFWLPKAQLHPQLEQRIAIYESVTPPDDIADDWQAVHDQYVELEAAVAELPADGLIDNELIVSTNELSDATGRISSAFSEHCL